MPCLRSPNWLTLEQDKYICLQTPSPVLLLLYSKLSNKEVMIPIVQLGEEVKPKVILISTLPFPDFYLIRTRHASFQAAQVAPDPRTLFGGCMASVPEREMSFQRLDQEV